MIWVIPYAVLVPLLVVCAIIFFKRDFIKTWILGLALFISIISVAFMTLLPLFYYDSRNVAWSREIYYETLIQPNVISETETTVTVSNFEAGIWQAGGMNLPKYNAYLRTNRYWSKHWLGRYFTYPAANSLKYVIIGRK